jgi:tetratricopeptide (TPR) repeat protein
MPLPYPHRATFLASTLVVPLEQAGTTAFLSRLISLTIFDHFLRHPIVTLGDDDERLADADGRLLDANHPQIEDSIDWLFRISRRNEVMWFEISVDRARTQATLLHSRLPNGITDEWTSSPDLPLSQQLSQCLVQWLKARRLPMVASLPDFTVEDLRTAADRLKKANAMLSLRDVYTQLPATLFSPLPRLAVPYLRVLAEVAGNAARTVDPKILEVDPGHPVARRNVYVTKLVQGTVDRRDILPLVTEAPMYGKPHLSIWGEPFAADRPLENMGVRHQGIASSLMPANPYACHNYSLQLAEVGRREESYRWADRATVAGPDFGAAHLDCVRRLRQVGRPGQAFAEAQYRCREILDRAAANKLPPNDWPAPHHASLLIAFVHLDIGRLAEAIELADEAIARVPNEPAQREAFAWAVKRVSHWKADAGLLARAYAWEGYHRGDPGRAISGLARGRITDEEDAMIMIDSLIAIGREDQAEIAVQHCAGLDGVGALGDGKARLAAARASILVGKLDDAIDHIQIVQLRRAQSRHEAEINRLLRLAAIRPAEEWTQVIDRRLQRGAKKLAQLAARDLADFVPGMSSTVVQRALGDMKPITLDPHWVSDLIGALPAAQATAAQILQRLARPDDDSLESADTLAAEWWSALVPPAKDRDAHAAGAVLSLGVALVQYIAEASVAPSPIAGAYRHIATEALHLVRRSRYQIEPSAIRALLALVERLGQAPEWLLDIWLLRIERALDLEAEHGAYLENFTSGLPVVSRLLRGDERTGWEVRMAHDLAVDLSQYEPAARLFERCERSVEAGTVSLAWSCAATRTAPAQANLDVHWIAALANPTGVAAPWLAVAQGLLATGKPKDGFAAACRGMTAATAKERPQAITELTAAWRSAGITTPIDGDRAYDAGLAAAQDDKLDDAIQHLRWAVATEPGNATRAQSLAGILVRAGKELEAIRVLAAHDRNDAPRAVGKLLVEAKRYAEAIPILRYAMRRSRSPDDFAMLAITAGLADNDAVAVEAAKRALQLGAGGPELMMTLATGLYRLGDFVECEKIAQQLITLRGSTREIRPVGLHAMARALAGQGRHVDAHPYAKEASRLGATGELAREINETMDCIVAQSAPPIRFSGEVSMERQAFRDLEAGNLEQLTSAITSPSWSIARAALAACEFRTEDENGIPVAPRALDAALDVLERSAGTASIDAVLARIRALRIRDNAYIQIDPPPPLGLRFTAEEFERAFMERDRRPHRASALLSYAR